MREPSWAPMSWCPAFPNPSGLRNLARPRPGCPDVPPRHSRRRLRPPPVAPTVRAQSEPWLRQALCRVCTCSTGMLITICPRRRLGGLGGRRCGRSGYRTNKRPRLAAAGNGGVPAQVQRCAFGAATMAAALFCPQRCAPPLFTQTCSPSAAHLLQAVLTVLSPHGRGGVHAP